VAPGGLNHWGLVVAHDGVVQRMADRVVASGGTLSKLGRREGGGVSEAFAYVRDPDGYAVELSTQAVLYALTKDRWPQPSLAAG
jgi:catechol 2,3-dioxygenase-like lactoylglutathione lyase family enzyme